MKLSIIIAIANNNIIGCEGRLPWKLPADLQRFKKLTMGHCLIMGRKTYESIGKPLVGRTSIVITRNRQLELPPSVFKACDPETAISTIESLGCNEAFVIGGAEIYNKLMPQVSRLHLTRVLHDVPGDTTFILPALDKWYHSSRTEYPADTHNQYARVEEIWDRL